jgi:hypothetical protein
VGQRRVERARRRQLLLRTQSDLRACTKENENRGRITVARSGQCCCTPKR